MEEFGLIKAKLASFIRRYYVNELIKGAILFFATGLLYFLIVLFVEYFFWLQPTGRTILFWFFIAVEILLFAKFILIPLGKLFKFSKGLNEEEASKIIGKHFPEINDKLLNVFQLSKNTQQSELILAGINQKARELKPIPFKLAVNLKSNLKFLKYAALPVIIILLIYFSGSGNLFADSYERINHYNIAYERPAPFSFQIMNDPLLVRENEEFELQVKIVGKTMPETASIHLNGQNYFLNEISPGLYKYTFEPLNKPVDFHFSGNEVVSKEYRLEVVKVPKMLNFEMFLDFPAYTGIKDNIQEGSGNAKIPEGTKIQWKLKTSATNKVSFILPDTTVSFQKLKNDFSYNKRFYADVKYQITTSNGKVKDYEKLAYALEVIKDQYPELELEHKKDSINESLYFHGKVSDDYGISEVRLVVYPKAQEDHKIIRTVPVSNASFDQFYVAFPDTLKLQQGLDYEFYFEVSDNDALHNYKTIKSEIFSFRRKTDEELRKKQLIEQNEAIKSLDESLDHMEFSEKEIQELTRLQRKKGQLDYNDRNKLNNFLQRQKRQNELMKNYSDKLEKSLEDLNEAKQDPMGKMLRERLERREERLEENEELLKKLEEYAGKISKEKLGEELEKLAKSNQNEQKNLEQLLELTKRYYVEEKTAKVGRELSKLSKEQEMLSEAGGKNTTQKQDSLNRTFNRIEQEIEEIRNENQNLKEPMKLGLDKKIEGEIKEQQEKASENLEQENKSDAQKNQKNAAERMKALSQKLKTQRATASGKQMQEDVTMLRQILDNLLVFSFEQENLLEDFKSMENNNPLFANKLKQQNNLKEHFEHVDDSLYALALRNPMLTEKVTEKLTNIEFDLQKALERFSQNEIRRGIGSQQYIITGANDLAYFLSQILGNMQKKLNNPSGKGGGESTEIQLPDIIKKQEQLNQEMKEGLQKQKRKSQEEKSGKGNEELNGALYEIFKRQQNLRETLQEHMKNEGMEDKDLQDDMEQIEKELLENGFNENTLNRMMNLEHKLLNLENARLKQGKKPERNSKSSNKDFENRNIDEIIKAKEYFNSNEILNRQSLPLRQIYKQKVREYFGGGDH